ncbi:hypothetical protein MNBD_ALPHA02-2322 [hydrothermal vent metagenome]|uniref:PepSY domain-containing protein n=1 Tax=hydrothermal vent metagenome TaxID=652676 RepID=A0A3B0RZK3_9ZZZZ
MTKTTTIKAISMATAIALTTSFGSIAYAHDTGEAARKEIRVSKNNARNLVKSLLKRDYNAQSFKALPAKKIGDKWVVRIKSRTATIATAYVDEKTGNIHVK